MRYAALATDYDGTIAHHGTVDDATLAALRRARAGGLRLLLVTGRQVPGVHDVFGLVEVFDRVVAENGAVLYDPATGAERLLTSGPPAALVDDLRGQGVPLGVGRSVVSTYEPHGAAVLAAIARLGLDWRVTMNNDAVMALPAGVTKASGLAAALAELGVPAGRCVGVGDAENDLDLLAACGLGVAVANALPALKSAAAWVTAGDRGAGVAELIGRMLDGTLVPGGEP